MKKVIFTLLSLFVLFVGYSQTTYYWVGGTAPGTSFTSNGNWNTMLDGTGTSRSSSAATDVLIFDGTNVGGTTPTTGQVRVVTGSTALGRLILQNGADVSFGRNTVGGTSTMTIGDDPSGDDLVVFAGCTMRFSGLDGSLLVLLKNDAGNSNSPPATTSATGIIYGNVVMEDGTNSIQNRFTSRFKGALKFVSGSTFTTSNSYAFYPFGTTGSSTTPAVGGVVFEGGSSYFYNGGSGTYGNPFGSNSVSFNTEFMPGSKFHFRAPAASNMFSGRKYGDVIVENNTTLTADGSLLKIDSLRVENGSTFITHTSGVTLVNGDIMNNGTIMVPAADPDRNNKIVMINSIGQSIKGTGTYTLGNFIISNVANVALQRTIQVDSSTIVFGILNPNGYSITGPGTTTIKSPATYNVTGEVNTDSFLVKNISDFTGIEIGMSISGTNIQPNTVISNLSTANGTVTMSKPAIGVAAYNTALPLIIFNGGRPGVTGKFGSISAALQNEKVRINWTILTEESIIGYAVERSANSREFTEIGFVKASGIKQYVLLDEAPMVGNNFYRIKAIGKDGDVKYSVVVKVFNGTSKGDVAIYPNPVKGGELNVQLNNMAKGSYSLRLINSVGQLVLNKVIAHQGGSLNQFISLPASVKPGMYSLQVSGAELLIQRKVLVQ